MVMATTRRGARESIDFKLVTIDVTMTINSVTHTKRALINSS